MPFTFCERAVVAISSPILLAASFPFLAKGVPLTAFERVEKEASVVPFVSSIS